MTEREAVARALAPKAWTTDHPGDGWEMMRQNSLRQADAAIAAMREREVKPLEWKGFNAGPYRIDVKDGGIATLLDYSRPDDDGFPYEMQSGYLSLVSVDDLKAVAQADYEACIRSALATDGEG